LRISYGVKLWRRKNVIIATLIKAKRNSTGDIKIGDLEIEHVGSAWLTSIGITIRAKLENATSGR